MTRNRLVSAIRPHRIALAACVALMLLESGVALVVPWLGGRIASGLLGDGTFGIDLLAPALLGLFALQAGLRIAHVRILSETSARLVAGLKRDLYRHLQRLPVAFFQARSRGDVISLLTREVEYLSDFVMGPLLGLLPTLLTLVGALVLMLRIDPLLSIPVLIGIPALTVALRLVGRRVRPLAGEMREAYGETVSVAEQNFGILPMIKAYTREDIEAGRHDRQVLRYRDAALRFARIQSSLGPVVQLLTASSIVVILWLASARVSEGQMAPGELVAFLLYAGLLSRPVAGLANAWGQFQHARGALAHLREVWAIEAEDTGGGEDPGAVAGAIAFEGVHFAYPGRTPVLHGVDLEIAPGETVALTGPNGAGKSTLVDLLLRFQTPARGRIRLDGRDIAGLDLTRLRQAIAMVPQDPMLVDGTILENIRFGNPKADREDIERAARAAQALDFIATLPDGIETLIGDRGVRLSGGQRQRIALARALLKSPAILILDEPTAMFDPDGEEQFVRAARAALRGRTVILITHRPASLALADRVVRLVDGRISADEASSVARPA